MGGPLSLAPQKEQNVITESLTRQCIQASCQSACRTYAQLATCASHRSGCLVAQVTASKSPERKGEGHTAEKLNLRGVEVYKQQQAMSYKDIEHLAFGFKHIVQIDHLEGLFNLKKLQLDNNCLTKIENLGHLVCYTASTLILHPGLYTGMWPKL